MNIKISPNTLCGKVSAISSKSYAHRALICAALSENKSQIYCSDISDDIKATVNCLNGIGASIKYIDKTFFVNPINTKFALEEIDCGESGSTLRFILPIVCALGLKIRIKMHGRLPNRPIYALVEQLENNGCKIKQEEDVLFVEGKLKSANYTIPGNVSSQFITGLLFALPLLEGKSTVTVTGPFESFSYIKLTLQVLSEFGVKFGFCDNRFEVNHTKFIAKDLAVEGDWSNAAFWLCAGAFSQQGVTVDNLNLDSVQGDKKILDILREFGANLTVEDNSVTVKKGGLKGVTVDAADIPDLVPIICVLATGAKGETNIINASRLRIKESDRIKTVVDLIESLGGKIDETEDGMIVSDFSLSGGEIDSYNDHRIAMSGAIASCLCKGDVLIKNSNAVNKSYPKFFDDFNKLNGNAKEML